MYNTIFAQSSAHAEIDFKGPEITLDQFDTISANLTHEMDKLDAEIEQGFASAELLNTIAFGGGQVGAPKTEAEKMYLAMATMSAFNGNVEFKAITEYSMEDLDDEAMFGYSMESLRSRAQSIYAWIREQVMKVYEIVERFFYNLLGAIPNARKAAAKLRKRAESLSGKSPSENSFETNGAIATTLCAGDETKLEDATKVISGLEMLTNVLLKSDRDYTAKLKQMGEDLEKKLDAIEVDATKHVLLGSINSVYSAAEPVKQLRLDKPFGLDTKDAGKDKRFADRNCKVAALMSGKSLFVHERTPATGENVIPKVAVGEANLSLTAEVRDTKENPKKIDSGKMSTWSTSDCEALADGIEAACDAIEAVSRGAAKGDITKMKDKLDKVAKKLNKKVETEKAKTGDDKLSAEKLANVRVALKYTKQYADLVQKPVPQFIALTTTFLNAGLNVANKSLSLHK